LRPLVVSGMSTGQIANIRAMILGCSSSSPIAFPCAIVLGGPRQPIYLDHLRLKRGPRYVEARMYYKAMRIKDMGRALAMRREKGWSSTLSTPMTWRRGGPKGERGQRIAYVYTSRDPTNEVEK